MSRKMRSVVGVAIALGSIVSATGTAVAAPTVTRYQGPDRYATSAAVVDASYSPGVPVAYIATGLNFPDALAGGAAAANDGGPLLLVQPHAIPAPVVAELQRLQPGRIVLLGGVTAVDAAVEAALQTYTTGTVTRVAGAGRYETAASLAARFPAGSPVYIATGANFPDALAATAAAAAQHAAILLTDPATLPPATSQALGGLAPSSITIVGGTGAVSAAIMQQLSTYSPVVTRIAGADRYATASAIAASAFPSATGIFLAAGSGFADALTGGPVAGISGEPLLLATQTCLPVATADEVAGLQPATATLLGGIAALGTGVEALTTCPAAPVPVPLPAPAFTFGNGTHQVGNSFPAGTYRTRANAAGCYWERLRGFSGQLSDVIANDLTDFHAVVTIAPSDAGFRASGCATWTNNLSAITASQTAPFSDGTWIVNTDIAPGTWSATGGSSCYWARLSDFSDSISGIIANDLGTTSPIVTISATDVGFISHSCGAWSQ